MDAHDTTMGHHGSSDNSNDDAFCTGGMAMNMFMAGFHSSLFGGTRKHCIVYLFRHWILDDAGKFQGAMVYTFLLSVLAEGLAYAQSRLRRRMKSKPLMRRSVNTLLYGLQQCVALAVMLLSMTFSIELFACVIVGLLVGRVVFSEDNRIQPVHHNVEASPSLGELTPPQPTATTSGSVPMERHQSEDSTVRRRTRRH